MSACPPFLLFLLVLLVPGRLPGFFALTLVLLAQRFRFEFVPISLEVFESV